MIQKVKQCLTKTSKAILYPIIENPIFFVCALILMVIPSIYYKFSVGCNWKGVIAEMLPTIHYYLFDAYVASVVLALFCKIASKKIVKSILYIILFIPFIVDLFIVVYYDTRVSPLIIRLIRETNFNEIEGFATTLYSPYFLFLLIGITIISLSIFFVEKKSNLSKHLRSSIGGSKWLIISILPILVITLVALINIRRNTLLSLAYFRSESIYELNTYKLKYFPYAETRQAHTTYGHLIQSLYWDHIIQNDVNILEKTLLQQYQTFCTYKSSKIVLIVGESFNKHHSNLYGYQHITNPNLLAEKETNNLYCFDDVISPLNSTCYVMQQIFTFKNQDNSEYWAETPIFVKFFKDNGYQTSLFSNQEVLNQDNDMWDSANHFLVAEQTRNHCFTTTNLYKYRWDTELINEYRVRNKIDSLPSFAVFHLIGQHFGYEDRYPQNEKVFSADDYEYRTDLTIAQRKMVAHYDNATLHNDKVVTSIIDIYRDQDAIIVYLSDHGEEVHDYRNYTGRTPTTKLTPEICKYQFEIPFMIWMSDTYKENHPDVVKQVESSLDKPFMIDDLPHLMLDIAGIDCEWFDPTRSLINERYNSNRKRLVSESKIDYDYMIKQLNK